MANCSKLVGQLPKNDVTNIYFMQKPLGLHRLSNILGETCCTTSTILYRENPLECKVGVKYKFLAYHKCTVMMSYILCKVKCIAKESKQQPLWLNLCLLINFYVVVFLLLSWWNKCSVRGCFMWTAKLRVPLWK